VWINANTPVACLDGDCRSADLLNPSSRSIAVSRSRQTSSVPNFSGNAMARAEETGGGAVDLPVEPAAVFAEAHARVGRGGIEAGEGRVSSTRDRGRTASHFAREVREVASRRRRIRRSTCGRRRLARWTRGTNSSVESSLTRGRGRHSLAGSSVCRCQARRQVVLGPLHADTHWRAWRSSPSQRRFHYLVWAASGCCGGAPGRRVKATQNRPAPQSRPHRRVQFLNRGVTRRF